MYFFIDLNQQVKYSIKKLNPCENSISALNRSACSSGGGWKRKLKHWQKGKPQKETFLSLAEPHPLVYNSQGEQQHDCPTSCWPDFSRKASLTRSPASKSEGSPCPSLFFTAPPSPSPPLDGIQQRGATENSPAAHAKVTRIIKTQVGIETRHGKIIPQYQGLDKKKTGGKERIGAKEL